MHIGWTNKGKYTVNGRESLYRIEQVDYGFYLFIFSNQLENLERDELHDTINDAKASAIEWGANETWRKEKWKISFSSPPKGFSVSSFYDKHGVKVFDYLKTDSVYIEN